ncbi:MAG: substrate-binding domain-containing protein [Anaerolineae bacterium]
MLDRLFQRFKPSRLKPQDTIKIGVLSAQTGVLAHYGRTAVEGLHLGIEYATGGTWEIAGKRIHLLIEDDGGDPAFAQQKARALIEQKAVDILQGCTSSSAAVKIAQIAQTHERLFVVAVAATDVLTAEWFNPYIFRTASTTSQDAAAGGQYAVQHLGRRFAFLSPDYIWGHQSRAAWWRAVLEQGGEIVGDFLVPQDERDFRNELRAILERRPDVLVPSWAGRGTAALLLQMREVGVFEAVSVIADMPDYRTVEAAGAALEGMTCVVKYYHGFPRNAVNDWLVRRHREQYERLPDIFTADGFAAGVALVAGLKRTSGDPGAAHLIPVLEGMSFEGPKGTYTFRAENHQALQPMYIAEMERTPGQEICVPRLIREVSAEECAPRPVEPCADT